VHCKAYIREDGARDPLLSGPQRRHRLPDRRNDVGRRCRLIGRGRGDSLTLLALAGRGVLRGSFNCGCQGLILASFDAEGFSVRNKPKLAMAEKSKEFRESCGFCTWGLKPSS